MSQDGGADLDGGCQISEAGEVACVFGDMADSQVAAVHGTLEVASPGQITGSGRLYVASGGTLAGGITGSADLTITGGLLSDSYRSLDLTLNVLGRVMRLSTTFDHYYLQDSDLTGEISGVYTAVDIFGSAAAGQFGSQASLSIDPDGEFLMQDASGCIGSGQLGIIDIRYNMYSVALTVANCPGLDGDYSGLGHLSDFAWVNNATVLQFTVFSGAGFILGQASK